MLRSGFELHQPSVAALRSFITTLADMFHVSHLAIADVPKDGWSLEVGGLVRSPMTLTCPELQKLPRRRVLEAHEWFSVRIEVLEQTGVSTT